MGETSGGYHQQDFP